MGPRPLGLYYTLLQQAVGAQTFMAGGASSWSHLFDQPSVEVFLQGVAKYRTHPWQRPMPEVDYEVVHHRGRVRLLRAGQGKRSPVLLVPSMINKPYIFDLLPDTSLVQALLKAGHTVYMLDWGDPACGNSGLTVETAVTEHLLPALEKMPTSPAVVGYCMGGLLALAAAQLAPKKVAKLVLAATPWDFAPTQAHKVLKQASLPLEALLIGSPLIPVDMVQSAFVSLDPAGAARRLQAFARETEASTLNRLAAIEDWLADGVALEPSVAKTLLLDWYRDNLPVRGRWRVGGEVIDPTKIALPTCLVVPGRDTLVPPAGSLPLAENLPQVTVKRVASGHVGLMAGRRAANDFFNPLVAWLG